jgi:hypothetical protein
VRRFTLKSRELCSALALTDGEQEWVVDKISNHNLIKAKKALLLGIYCLKGSYENSWHEFKDLKGALTSWRDT